MINTNTPQSNRIHVTIFGETNSGKSALFNSILGTNTSIVSDISGTTTDPVSKSMELIPFGPIVITDTGGINDKTILGEQRIKKTISVLNRTDFAIYTIDLNNYDENEFEKFKYEFKKRKIPYIILITKKDITNKNKITEFKNKNINCYDISINSKEDIKEIKTKIIKHLSNIEIKEQSMIYDLVKSKSTILLVIPIDSEAPKGRLILPQVQLIRDCLDHQINCNITTLNNLENSIKENKNISLVVTDSQIFKEVSEIVPENIYLTSFSILMAKQKGNIEKLIEGAYAIDSLKDNSKVLIAETCIHTKNHEDIGNIKIPNGIKKYTRKNIIFEFSSGKDFPDDLNKYDLIIHCGGCMITQKEMNNRINFASEKEIPITNYGIAIAYINGIFKRSIEIITNNKNKLI